MKLNKEGLKNHALWEEKGYQLPKYDHEKVADATKKNPFWIHFGAGNIFRAFHANVVQNLLDAGVLERGLVVAEGYDYEIIEKMNHPHDDYSILVTLKSDGTMEKSVTGSIVESLALDSENEKAFGRLKEIFASSSLQMATFAKGWASNESVPQEFVEYVSNPKEVSFPWSMIDKITPRPNASVEEVLQNDGVEELAPVITSKNTYVAPFVNAEECEYLVIEDAFPNGRPALEKGGLIFTDRETVDKVERMKVCTCLNPLHTALAVFGCLLDFQLIADEMKDEDLRQLVEVIGYKEGLPVVTDPKIINPKDFIDTVLKIRIPNPFMPDTPQRIATDTSQKLSIRFGETIKAYEKSEELKTSDLKLIPLVFAGWLRYLLAVDDNGNAFELSPDPMLQSLCPVFSDVQLGETAEIEEIIRPILKDKKIFGVDLYEVGLAEKVCGYFKEMLQGTGAVRETLKKYVWEK